MTTTRFAAVVLVAAAAAACQSARDPHGAKPGSPAKAGQPQVQRELRDYRTVWLQAKGKVGFVKTYLVGQGTADAVVLHFCEDLENREVGWYGNGGQGVRYAPLTDRMGAARREAYDAVELPRDTEDNQVRRLLGLEPDAAITILPTTQADLRR
jgi:hypothetical protein